LIEAVKEAARNHTASVQAAAKIVRSSIYAVSWLSSTTAELGGAV
jgi:hypothetical protein